MKKLLILLLVALTMLTPGALAENGTAIYVARLEKDAPLKTAPSRTADHSVILPAKSSVDILELGPEWVLVRSAKGATGYIRRYHIDFNKVQAVNPATTPPYPAVISQYLVWVARQTEIREAPDVSANSLITMNPGARLAVLDVEDGWAKVIFKRQYGYLDTRDLSEMQPVAGNTENPDGLSPIAAYTSFYNLATNEENLNRIENIAVANNRMRMYTIRPGDSFDFNRDAGPYSRRSGYLPAPALVDGGVTLSYGGGTCQVSSTLYNTLMQLPGISILKRRPHGPGGAKYLPLHADAAVGNVNLNLIFRNFYPFSVRIDGSSQDGALTIVIWPTVDQQV